MVDPISAMAIDGAAFNTLKRGVSIGRDIESITLAKAVQYHSEQRVFLNNNKTVIFK